jgi:hypothetical protein
MPIRDLSAGLDIKLKSPRTAEYISRVPFMFRKMFFKLEKNKDPWVLPINLNLVKRKPQFILQIAEMFFRASRKH